MATFYLIRHGKPDYTYGDTHGFIGQGHDFAPLKQDRIREVIETSKDARLKNAQIIVASPYTRALQTASIISKETGLEIVVEPDIREWQPDLTYQYKNSDEMKRYYKDYIEKSVLTTDFLVSLLNDNIRNIKCFSESALEKEVKMTERGTVKFWQAAVINDGYQIRNIPLNDERVEFFLSIYDKDSSEYEYCFKEQYKRYLREKNSTLKPENRASELAGMMALAGALLGMSIDSAIDLGTDIMNAETERQSMLPIRYDGRVPKEYSKKYDSEEYLLEVYKKIGIQVLRETDDYYYSVILPENGFRSSF